MNRQLKKIGVVCTSIFHIIHTRYIVSELIKQEVEVVYINFSAKNVGETADKLKNYLQSLDLENCDYIDFFSRQDEFDAIIAHHFFPGLQLISPKLKKIRILYGYAKDAWNYAEWNKVFDVVLTYGPYAEKRLVNMTKVINIGHPRLQEAYEPVKKDSTGKRFVKNQNKPILVYCPTWTDISSMDLFLQHLQQLEEMFVVLVKLHHNALLSNANILADMKDVYLFNEYVDLFDLLSISDIVLSDYSGAIFDAMLFRKPIVLLDTVDNHILDTGIVNTSKMTNIMESHAQISNETSLDITVRSYVNHSKNFEEVCVFLKGVLTSEKLGYEKLLPELYSYEDEFAAKRAADAIIDTLQDVNNLKEVTYKKINVEMMRQFFEDKSPKKIAIWGAGELGQVLYAWLKSEHYYIDCFFDMDSSKIGKEIDGVSIRQPSESHKIIIAVTNYHIQIAQTLNEKGYKELKDFIYPF